MSAPSPVLRIARNAVMLAFLCVVGMFSLPLMDNVKVSLQLLAVFIIALTAASWYDTVIVTGCYLLLGLFLPIYAGFSAGVSPTFGYVISFVVAGPIIYWMNRIPKIHFIPRMALACLSAMPVVYAIGTGFMMAYLQWDISKTLLVSVVPYLPFDAAKIALAVAIVALLPPSLRGGVKKKKEQTPTEEKGDE